MFFRKKIPCYVLVFDQLDIIKKSLDFLAKKTDQLEIIVIENPSRNSSKIKRYVEGLGLAGVVSRYYIFEKNITANAIGVVLEAEAKRIRKSPIVMVTDGDLTCDDSEWLTEELSILKSQNDVFACGVTLDLSNLPIKAFPEAVNWIPKPITVHDGYFEALTGLHLLIFRGSELSGFCEWQKSNNTPFVDGRLHEYCYEVMGMKWARTKNAQARHLTWDLYADREHAYTKIKTAKDFKSTWHHNKTADFQLINYS
jgi:hypothetical protein